MRLVYSVEAVADLARFRKFIAEHDPRAAARVGADLVARMEHLKQFPAMGREVVQTPEPTAIRDAIFGDYVVRYSSHTDVIIVLRIWHHNENRGERP